MDEYIKKHEAIRYASDLASQSLEGFLFAHELLKKITLEGDLDLSLDGLEFAEKQFRKAKQTQLEILAILNQDL